MIYVLDEALIGDIVQLKNGNRNPFKKPDAAAMPDTGHNFVIVATNPLVVCPVSSRMYRVGKYDSAIAINDWKSAHLVKPSYVSTNTFGKIKDTDIYKTIGRLRPNDLARVLKQYTSYNGVARQKLEFY